MHSHNRQRSTLDKCYNSSIADFPLTNRPCTFVVAAMAIVYLRPSSPPWPDPGHDSPRSERQSHGVT